MRIPLRFTTRLILAVTSVLVILLALLVWNSVRLISSSHSTLFRQQVHQLTGVLANSLAAGLARNDRAAVEDVVSLLKRDKSVVYLAVNDRKGDIVARYGALPASADAQDNGKSLANSGIYSVKRNIVVDHHLLGSLEIGYGTQGISKLTRATRLQNTTIAIAALVAAVSLVVIFAYILTRGLRQLEEGAMAMRAGDFDYRIQAQSGSDIENLAHSFNSLAHHLQDTQLELECERAALLTETSRLSTLINGINAVVWEAPLQDEWCFRYVSDNVQQLLGFPPEAWLHADFLHSQVHVDDYDALQLHLQMARPQGATFSLEHRIYTNAGDLVWLRHICVVEETTNGDLVVRGLMFDISESKAAEAQIVFLAEHDGLTGLINRRKFQEELMRQVSYAHRYKHQGVLLFLDLDQFKYINDSFGHHAGDEFLVQVAGRLRRALRTTDVLGRLGGDEFGIILPECDEQNAKATARHILDTLSGSEILVRGVNATRVSASIGMIQFPREDHSPSELLASADAAMYMAKDSGRNNFHWYTSADKGVEHMYAQVHWEDKIRNALAEERFALYCQPVYDLRANKVVHHEVLLRMLDQDANLIMPSAFLSTAERFGLIRGIDRWVMENSIRLQGQSVASGAPISLAVNVSGRYFGQPDVLEFVKEKITQYQADPRCLIFEVTETAAVENVAYARGFIESLRAMGCRFALDDFGVGFSSLHYLKNLQVDFVKIDGSFVRNVRDNESDKVFVKAIKELADALNIMTIAEFVDSAEVSAVLSDLQVNYGQGYYLGKPIPIADIMTLH